MVIEYFIIIGKLKYKLRLTHVGDVLSKKREEKPYRLIPEELPKSARAVRGSEYDGLLDEFCKGNVPTARVDYPGKTAKALMAGLRSRIKKRELTIRLSLRKGNLYLAKE